MSIEILEPLNSIFSDCTNLKTVNFITDEAELITNTLNLEGDHEVKFSFSSKVKISNAAYMFEKCSSVKVLDVSKFKTDKVTNMDNMFSQCSNLKNVKVSDSFTMENVSDYHNIVDGCDNLDPEIKQKIGNGGSCLIF